MNELVKKLNLFVITMTFLVISGCKSMDPNPELKDPIYLDITKDIEELRENLLKEEVKYQDLLKERLKVKPRSEDKLRNKVEITKARKKIQKFTQKLQYLEIRLERRKVEGRRSYRIAFQNGESWPKPEEFENYLTNKRLRNAKRDWNLRVPKLKKKKRVQ